MLRPLLIALSQTGWLKRLVVRHPLARRVARRFVAGETLEDALEAVAELRAAGMETTLDLLGENVLTAEAAREAAARYRDILVGLKARSLTSHLSLKLTQMGLDLGEELCLENLVSVVEAAAREGTFVRVDMEGSDCTERTLRIVARARERHENVGVVIQSYLRRSAEDVAWANRLGLRIRLCKGAYAEPPNLAYQRREEVDGQFLSLMEDLLRAGHRPAIATHDERMIQGTLDFARREGIPREAWEFQMLYGIRRERQRQLRREGYNLRVYVPFGTEWYPYFMRRLAERPANLVFFLTALARG